jgi:hypothetical protein
MLENVGDIIVAIVRNAEGLPTKQLIPKATADSEKGVRTIRNHLKALDGKRIRIDRSTRDQRIYSIEYWERMQQRTYGERARHTARLKEVLAVFRNEIPQVDSYGAQRVKDGVAPAYDGDPRPEYDPDEPLRCEGMILFPDLIGHLDVLEGLGVTPSAAWRGFKDRVQELQRASNMLSQASARWVEDAFELPVGDPWQKKAVSSRCVESLYDQAFAAAAGQRKKLEFLRDGPSPEARMVDGWIEIWCGAYGVIRQRGTSKRTASRLKSRVEGLLKRLGDQAEDSEIQALAGEVNRAFTQAAKTRERLVRALLDAEEYDAFPGSCKYVGGN